MNAILFWLAPVVLPVKIIDILLTTLNFRGAMRFRDLSGWMQGTRVMGVGPILEAREKSNSNISQNLTLTELKRGRP